MRNVPLAQTAPVIGRLVATRAGFVAARVNGPVERFDVEVGDRVNQGETLAVLDRTMLSARRDQAAGALAEAQAALTTRREQLRLAEQELARLERLKTSAAFSEARYNDQRQEAVIARAQVSAAEAAVQTARADLQVARLDLERAEIKAPYAGAITARLVETGAYIAAGTNIVRMVSDRALEVAADVPSQRLSGLTRGRTVMVDLGDGIPRSATVRAVVPEEDPGTRTREVRFVPSFPTESGLFASGQSATVAVPLGDARHVLSVHKDAVIRRNDQAIVYIAAKGEAQVRTVQLGAEIGTRFEVLDGLTAGDLAIVRGNERLRPGDAVSIVKRLGPETSQAREAEDNAG